MSELFSHLAFILCLLGLIVFAVCSAVGKYPDLKEIARLTFVASLLAALLAK
jgi:hypothetical protein